MLCVDFNPKLMPSGSKCRSWPGAVQSFVVPPWA
jgi:hypothetical protein